MTHSELRKLNRIFGEEFGWNPHGQPNFRWMRTEEMFWFVDHGNGYIRRPSGLITYERNHERRCWADRLGRCWILTKWVFTSKDDWERQHGDKFPWPKHGEWNPIENWKPDPENPGQEPTVEITREFCAALRWHRSQTFESFLGDMDRDWESYRLSKKNEMGDMAEEAMPAFGRVPGTHDGQTEFMGGSDELFKSIPSKETVCPQP